VVELGAEAVDDAVSAPDAEVDEVVVAVDWAASCSPSCGARLEIAPAFLIESPE
jgi:hypothetical protein